MGVRRGQGGGSNFYAGDGKKRAGLRVYAVEKCLSQGRLLLRRRRKERL